MIPNRFGFLSIGLFIIFSIVAAIYSNNLLFLLAFLHMSFLLVAILQTAKNLRHTHLISVEILSGFCGETSTIRILLQQNSKKSKTGLLIRGESGKQKTESVPLQELTPKDQLWITIPFQLPKKRGLYSFQRFRLSTESPYGLFYSWLYLKTNVEYYVYPSPQGIPLPILNDRFQHGDFNELRNYQIGDSLQRISWKHSGRSENLLVKEFMDSSMAPVELNWDDCPSPDPENKLRQLTRWVLDCESLRRDYRLKLPQTRSNETFSSGANHQHRELVKLALWKDS